VWNALKPWRNSGIKKIRTELGIAGKDAPEIKRLFSQGYQGARYSLGYAACPNLEDHAKLFDLLQPERIGVHLTEGSCWSRSNRRMPSSLHHPEARYFNI